MHVIVLQLDRIRPFALPSVFNAGLGICEPLGCHRAIKGFGGNVASRSRQKQPIKRLVFLSLDELNRA
jgi:hypothetical protein